MYIWNCFYFYFFEIKKFFFFLTILFILLIESKYMISMVVKIRIRSKKKFHLLYILT